MELKLVVSDIHIHLHDKLDREVLAQLAAVLSKLDLMETKIMTALDDELAAIKGSLDTIQTGVSALLAKIAAFPPAGLTAEQQTALDAINTEAQAIAVAATPA